MHQRIYTIHNSLKLPLNHRYGSQINSIFKNGILHSNDHEPIITIYGNRADSQKHTQKSLHSLILDIEYKYRQKNVSVDVVIL